VSGCHPRPCQQHHPCPWRSRLHVQCRPRPRLLSAGTPAAWPRQCVPQRASGPATASVRVGLRCSRAEHAPPAPSPFLPRSALPPSPRPATAATACAYRCRPCPRRLNVLRCPLAAAPAASTLAAAPQRQPPSALHACRRLCLDRTTDRWVPRRTAGHGHARSGSRCWRSIRSHCRQSRCAAASCHRRHHPRRASPRVVVACAAAREDPHWWPAPAACARYPTMGSTPSKWKRERKQLPRVDTNTGRETCTRCQQRAGPPAPPAPPVPLGSQRQGQRPIPIPMRYGSLMRERSLNPHAIPAASRRCAGFRTTRCWSLGLAGRYSKSTGRCSAGMRGTGQGRNTLGHRESPHPVTLLRCAHRPPRQPSDSAVAAVGAQGLQSARWGGGRRQLQSLHLRGGVRGETEWTSAVHRLPSIPCSANGSSASTHLRASSGESACSLTGKR
jgi:hypothetical protein